MNFRCYACGCLFSQGIPPLDALSDAQAGFVGMSDEEGIVRNMKSRTLDNTRFEGMSSGSFCEFCLVMLHEFPEGYNNKLSYTLKKEDIEEDLQLHNHEWPWDDNPYVRRRMKLDWAKLVYKNGDFSLVEELLTTGITKQHYFCSWPGCNTHVGFFIPARHSGDEACSKHQMTVTEITDLHMYRFWMVAMGHNFMDHMEDGDDHMNRCEPCWQVYNDWAEMQAAAAEEEYYSTHPDQEV